MRVFLFIALLVTVFPSLSEGIVYYSRPAVANNIPGLYSHSQLFNPEGSGVIVHVDKIFVSNPDGFHVLGYGGGIFNDATFPESRGLATHFIETDPKRYSIAHARTHIGSPIDGGQWFNSFGNGSPGIVELPIKLEPGASVVVRSARENQQVNVTFLWHEEDIQ